MLNQAPANTGFLYGSNGYDNTQPYVTYTPSQDSATVTTAGSNKNDPSKRKSLSLNDIDIHDSNLGENSATRKVSAYSYADRELPATPVTQVARSSLAGMVQDTTKAGLPLDSLVRHVKEIYIADDAQLPRSVCDVMTQDVVKAQMSDAQWKELLADVQLTSQCSVILSCAVGQRVDRLLQIYPQQAAAACDWSALAQALEKHGAADAANSLLEWWLNRTAQT